MPFYLLGRTSHNAYLEIAVEMGILGLGVFVTFLIYVGRKLLNATDQKRKDSRLVRGIALSSFASLLCSKLFVGGLLLVTWWITLAIIIGFVERFPFSGSQNGKNRYWAKDEGSHSSS
jgi:O-antigen ligase